MSLPQTEITYSIEEYLARERGSEERHEYLDGVIYEMAGESPVHGTISMNVSILVGTQLRGTPCQAFAKDTKVLSGPQPATPHSTKGMFSYPDLVVVCGEMKFHDKERHVLLNPTVIVEVLSPNTEAFDRGTKWLRYQRWLPTLRHYVMVAQERPRIELYSREPNGEWHYALINQLDASANLSAIGCVLKLSEVYDRVEFTEPEEMLLE